MAEAIHVPCAQCGVINRIPSSRLTDNPVCGKCKKRVLSGHPVTLNSQNFQAYVGRSELPILVDFWAQWCGPCKMMAPIFNQVASELEPKMRFGKVDTEAEQALANSYQIRSIPTLILFKNKQEIARQAGAMDLHNLKLWIQQYV